MPDEAVSPFITVLAVGAAGALCIGLAGFVWVRVHCPAAHRPGDKRAYVAHCWRVLRQQLRRARQYLRPHAARLGRACVRSGLVAQPPHGVAAACSPVQGDQAQTPDVVVAPKPPEGSTSGQSAVAVPKPRTDAIVDAAPARRSARMKPRTCARAAHGRGGTQTTPGAHVMTADPCAPGVPTIKD